MSVLSLLGVSLAPLDGKREFQKRRQRHSLVLSESLHWGRGGSSVLGCRRRRAPTQQQKDVGSLPPCYFLCPNRDHRDSLPPESGPPAEASVCPFWDPPPPRSSAWPSQPTCGMLVTLWPLLPAGWGAASGDHAEVTSLTVSGFFKGYGAYSWDQTQPVSVHPCTHAEHLSYPPSEPVSPLWPPAPPWGSQGALGFPGHLCCSY